MQPETFHYPLPEACGRDARSLILGIRRGNFNRARNLCGRIRLRLAHSQVEAESRRQEQFEALRGVADGIARLLEANELEQVRRLEPLLRHLAG